MTLVLKIIGILVLIYILFCIFVFFIQKYLIFFPSQGDFLVPKESNLQEVWIQTKDGIHLNSWFLDNKSDRTVIFFHGNGGNISSNQERLQIFNELHLNALMVDYRGYGKSYLGINKNDGTIQKESDLYTDADATYQYLIDKGIKPQNIIIWGQSLGGAIAIHLSQNKDVFATIVESSFTSMNDMASKQYGFLPTRLLLRFHFRSDEKIRNIISPLLLIHSRNDEMIPFSF